MRAPFLRSIHTLYKWFFFLPLLVISTVLGSLLVLLMVPFPFLRRHAYFVPVTWARFLASSTPAKVKVEGKENVDKGRSFIVVANHQSYYDILAMYGWSGIDMKFVMKKELKRIPFFGQGVAAMGHVFVDRSDRQKAIDSLNRSVQTLRKGESVIIYPEGTRSRDGQVHEFRKGAFRMALQTGMPLLPISIAGTYQVQPPDTFQLHPGKIAMRIHEPIEVEGKGENDLEMLMEACRERIIKGKTELERAYELSDRTEGS
ncbi:MAG: lysophospholipid acyltransferase family protein [Flavobacteriales bacterium]